MLSKRSESFDNDVFFDIEAKRTHLLVGKFILKRREHVYTKELKNRREANWFILKLNNIEAKRTGLIVILYLKSHKKANFRFFLNESV